MERLTIKQIGIQSGLATQMITGFSDDELRQLKNLPHEEAEQRLIAMLDKRNDGLGTAWACGYGMYGLWFDNEATYVNIGNSCD